MNSATELNQQLISIVFCFVFAAVCELHARCIRLKKSFKSGLIYACMMILVIACPVAIWLLHLA